MARIYDPKSFSGPLFAENGRGAKGWVDVVFFFSAFLREEWRGFISQRNNQAGFGVICRF